MEELCISVMTEDRRTTQMYKYAHPQGGVGEKWTCDRRSAEKKRRGNTRWRSSSVLQEKRIWNMERVAAHPKLSRFVQVRRHASGLARLGRYDWHGSDQGCNPSEEGNYHVAKHKISRLRSDELDEDSKKSN